MMLGAACSSLNEWIRRYDERGSECSSVASLEADEGEWCLMRRRKSSITLSAGYHGHVDDCVLSTEERLESAQVSKRHATDTLEKFRTALSEVLVSLQKEKVARSFYLWFKSTRKSPYRSSHRFHAVKEESHQMMHKSKGKSAKINLFGPKKTIPHRGESITKESAFSTTEATTMQTRHLSFKSFFWQPKLIVQPDKIRSRDWIALAQSFPWKSKQEGMALLTTLVKKLGHDDELLETDTSNRSLLWLAALKNDILATRCILKAISGTNIHPEDILIWLSLADTGAQLNVFSLAERRGYTELTPILLSFRTLYLNEHDTLKAQLHRSQANSWVAKTRKAALKSMNLLQKQFSESSKKQHAPRSLIVRNYSAFLDQARSQNDSSPPCSLVGYIPLKRNPLRRSI